jgi:AraC family transcriptional regulator of adaptative response / DNA-3-methyladenine glycosylase II
VIASQLAVDSRLARFVENCPGMRVPGAFDEFELAIRAILGQRISVRAATTLAGRLVERFGDPIETPFPPLNRLSIPPARLADAPLAEITALGIAAARAESIRAISRAISTREIDLAPNHDPETIMGKLKQLPGIGEWTAQYIAMRALRSPDAFPAGDLGLMKAWGETSMNRLRNAAEAWRPWRAYAAIYLWESLHLFGETQ